MKRGLYVGQFQPYTNAHKAFIGQMARGVDELVIVIASAQVSHHPLQPFTAGQRMMMISRDVKNAEIPVSVIPLEDVKKNSLWVSHIKSMVPPFDVVYASNPLFVQLFSEAGIEVISPGTCPHEVLHGGELCSLMATGDEWKAYMPEETVQLILETDAIERIRAISQSDA